MSATFTGRSLVFKLIIGVSSLIWITVAVCQESNPPAPSQDKLTSTSASSTKDSYVSPFELSVLPKACTIPIQVQVPALVLSKNLSNIRSAFYSTITKFSAMRGDHVKKGQLIASTDSKALAQMKAIYEDYLSLYGEQLKVALKGQKLVASRRDRLTVLLQKGIIPQADYDEVDKQVLAAADQVERIRRGIESTKKNVQNYTDQIRKANFYADLDGVITELIIDPRSMSGNLMVTPGALVAKIEQAGNYIAEAQMLDTQVHNIKVGMNAEVKLPDQSSLVGVVTFVSNLPIEEKKSEDSSGFNPSAANSAGGRISYKAIVDFKKDGPILPAGLLSSVKIVTGVVKADVCLPWNAIELDKGAPYIRAFREGMGLQRFPVELGALGIHEVQVVTPLSSSSVVLSKLW